MSGNSININNKDYHTVVLKEKLKSFEIAILGPNMALPGQKKLGKHWPHPKPYKQISCKNN